jgi:hypothetical protein
MKRLTADGLKCHYPFGGAFGFSGGVKTAIRGWVGPEDETIREDMRGCVRRVGEPYDERLARGAARVWREALAGVAWVMPGSHWSFELDHGSKDWLPGVLGRIGLDSCLLVGRTNAAAIEFLPQEEGAFVELLRGLFQGLVSSDFTLAFPGRKAIGLIHHHKQLWWVTPDGAIAQKIDQIDVG